MILSDKICDNYKLIHLKINSFGCANMAKFFQLIRKNSTPPKKEFTETELQDLRTAFDLLDRNQDGRVTVSELQFMLQNLGIQLRDEYIQNLIKEVTHTGAGLMDENEFLQWIARIQALRQEDENSEDDCSKDLVAAFRVFDRDQNGYITRDELRSAMDMIGEPVTDQQITDLLTLADVDKDGKINYEEFARLLL